ncbi:TPA: aromatic amino acid transport family protein, partial [Neisseria gonorrhoeae]
MPSESLFGRRGANTLQTLTLYGIMQAVFPEEAYMSAKTPSLFGGAMIIAGTVIGAGMLANPTAT